MPTRKHEIEESIQAQEPVEEHECEWEDAVEGPESVGKVCIICGAMKDNSDEDS